MIINGVLCRTLQELEDAILDLPEDQKELIRNDFNGITNVPQSSVQAVTPRQIRLALSRSGISLQTIEAVIDSLPEPARSETRITWEYSVEFQRSNPLLIAMAPVLGLSTAQVDSLFQLASTL